jgi:hypothetical protein
MKINVILKNRRWKINESKWKSKIKIK